MRATAILAMLTLTWPLAAHSLPAAPAETAEPRVLASGVSAFAPLGGSRVLCDCGETDQLVVIDTASGARSAWRCDWTPQADGWSEQGRVVVLKASTDRQWVCFAQEVGADALALAKCAGDKQPTGMLEGMDQVWAVAVLLCKADGSGARCVGLGIEVGGGPDYDFALDGARLVGQPFLPCQPDALHCYEYLSRVWEVPPVPQYNYIEVATGERGWIEELPISDGYWKCPYSDYFRAENNWYDEHDFSSFAGGGALGHYSCPPPEGHGMMHDWVLQDAVLLSQADGQGLLYVDGRFNPAPHSGWDVLCWLPDGTYIFSDDGGMSIKYGKVDWSSFSVDWYVERLDLLTLQYAYWVAMPDARGALALDWEKGVLWYVPASRAGSKP